MNSPTPVPTPPSSSSGWVPTQSTAIGGVLGGALAQLAVAGIEAITHTALSSATAAALSTVVVILTGYFFPDGGRK
jgi:hypothetical protein